MNKHKWHDEIVAWAGGAEIEVCDVPGGWVETKNPTWTTSLSYRIKPQPKQPNYLYCYFVNGENKIYPNKYERPNMKYIGKIEVQDD